MSEITYNVNWLAVVVGFGLSFALGWLWYSPKLFGAKWAEGVGAKIGDGTAMPPARPWCSRPSAPSCSPGWWV